MKMMDRFFGKRAAPTSAIAMVKTPEANFSDRTYRAFADEGYQKNVIAYRSISMVAQGVANVRMKLMKRRSGSQADEQIHEHKILDLLAKPNPGMNYQSFIETVWSFMAISGNTYIHGVGPSPGRPPNELWPIRPDHMKVIPGRLRLPVAYVFEAEGTKAKFEVDALTGNSAILHMKTFNPLNQWYGMSPIEAAAKSVDQHNASSAWNLGLLQNGARPSGAWVFNEDVELTEEQRESFKKQMDDLVRGGPGKAGGSFLMEGGATWKEMSIAPKDMDWIQGRNTSAREVALTYGVPPQLLGIPGDNTYSNYKEAKQAFYLDSIIPQSKVVAFYLTNWLLAAFDPTGMLYLEPDINAIEALEPMRSDKFTQVGGAGFLTINEKRELLGYGRYIKGKDDADVLLVPMGQTPLTDMMASGELNDDETTKPGDEEDFEKPPTDAPTPADTEAPVADSALNGAQVTALVDLVARVASGELPRSSAVQIVMISYLLDQAAAEAILGDAGDGFEPATLEPETDAPEADEKPDDAKFYATFEGKAVNLGSRASRERYRVAVQKRRSVFERRFLTQVKAAFAHEQADMIEAVKGINVDLIDYVVEDVVTRHEPKMARILRENMTTIMKSFGGEVLDLAKHMPSDMEVKADSTTRFESALEIFINNHVADRITSLARTTKRRVTRELRMIFSSGLEAGATSTELINAVKDTYSGFRSSRAATIVRTETGVAQNEAQRSAARALGVPGLQKTWISPLLPTSRDGHVAMHESSVGINEKFEVPSDDGVDLMEGPGDPGAPADQVINCHCVQVFGTGGKS